MKRIKLALIGIICLTIFGYVQSCSDSTTEIEQVPNLDIPEEFNEVGKLHNEGLEYVFNELKVAAIEYTKNPQLKGHTFLENHDEFVRQATLKFCQHNKKMQSHFDLCENVLKDNNILLKSGTTNINNPIIAQLLDETKVLIRENIKKKNDLSLLKVQLDAINNKAANILSEQDAIVIYCATSTGYASYQYWTENYRKWYFAIHYPEILEQYNDDELNQLQLKNGKIRTKGWLDDLWNAVESWWSSTVTAVEDWWDSGAGDIVIGDVAGGLEGAQIGLEITTATAGTGWTSIIICASGMAIAQSAVAAWL